MRWVEPDMVLVASLGPEGSKWDDLVLVTKVSAERNGLAIWRLPILTPPSPVPAIRETRSSARGGRWQSGE